MTDPNHFDFSVEANRCLRTVTLKLVALEAAEQGDCRRQLMEPPTSVRVMVQRTLAALPQRLEGLILEQRHRLGRRLLQKDETLHIELPAFNAKTCQPALSLKDARLAAALIAQACNEATSHMKSLVLDDEFDAEKEFVPYEYVLTNTIAKNSKPFTPTSPAAREDTRPDLRVVVTVSLFGVVDIPEMGGPKK